MTAENSTLIERLRQSQERLSPAGPKPQELPYPEIVERVRAFMLDQAKMRIALSFGNEVGEDLESANDARFDPIALLADHPDQLDEIALYVDWELESSEAELLRRKDSSLYAYNTLVFGAALRVAQSRELSNDLKGFLIDHLVSPKPPSKPKKQGAPKKTNDDRRLKVQAIYFAVAHGLAATRNDASSHQTSTCDAVGQAAKEIFQADGDAKFSRGYGYEMLKKVWHARRNHEVPI